MVSKSKASHIFWIDFEIYPQKIDSSYPHCGRILINVTGSILLKTDSVAGIVGENPIIIAVNGEGKEAKDVYY
jgi:hypothetical protein